MKYFNLVLGVVAIGLFLAFLILTLLNKFDNGFVQSTLNDNIVNLINGKRYTERTLKKIKFTLIFRVILFALGIIIMIHGRVNYSIRLFMPLILIAIRALSNRFIEKELERDYISWNDTE